MKNIKKIVSVLFSAILLFSATATNSIAMEKIHFVIGGGAGGGWDGTARGTGEALTKSGMLKSASFENMSGGGGGKALAFMINTQPKNTILVQSTPLVLRSITRHKGYVSGSGVLSYKDVTPIAGVIGDYGLKIMILPWLIWGCMYLMDEFGICLNLLERRNRFPMPIPHFLVGYPAPSPNKPPAYICHFWILKAG